MEFAMPELRLKAGAVVQYRTQSGIEVEARVIDVMYRVKIEYTPPGETRPVQRWVNRENLARAGARKN
jgi:hypothetical protein